jgi:hypothetical protein
LQCSCKSKDSPLYTPRSTYHVYIYIYINTYKSLANIISNLYTYVSYNMAYDGCRTKSLNYNKCIFVIIDRQTLMFWSFHFSINIVPTCARMIFTRAPLQVCSAYKSIWHRNILKTIYRCKYITIRNLTVYISLVDRNVFQL